MAEIRSPSGDDGKLEDARPQVERQAPYRRRRNGQLLPQQRCPPARRLPFASGPGLQDKDRLWPRQAPRLVRSFPARNAGGDEGSNTSWLALIHASSNTRLIASSSASRSSEDNRPRRETNRPRSTA